MIVIAEDYKFNIKLAKVMFHGDAMPGQCFLLSPEIDYDTPEWIRYFSSKYIVEGSQHDIPFQGIVDLDEDQKYEIKPNSMVTDLVPWSNDCITLPKVGKKLSIIDYTLSLPCGADYPTTFDELVYKMAHLFGNPFEEKEEENETIAENNETLENSALLDDAMIACNVFTGKWREFLNQKIHLKPKLNNNQEDNKELFLDEIVPLYAFEFFQLIDTMVTVEGWRPSAFPGYKRIKLEIDKEKNKQKRAMLVRQLGQLLESKIPASTKQKRPQIIVPKQSIKYSGSGDMENNYKSTNGK